MDDALVVRRGEAARDLERVVGGLAQRRRTRHGAAERLAQRFSFEELGDRVERAVRGAEIEDREDVGMRERGDRPGFALEAGDARRIR
jgi:hypothetical protein